MSDIHEDLPLKATTYTLHLFGADHPLRARYEEIDLPTITIECRGPLGSDSWAVCHKGQCHDGISWDHEPLPSSRTEAWLAMHRFPLHEALELAVSAARPLRKKYEERLQ